MSETNAKSTCEAIDIPTEAREPGAVEILRVGMMSDAPLVAARLAVDDPGMRGEVVADITRRITRLDATEGKYTYKDALVAIESALAAHLGPPVAQKTARKARRTNGRAKSRAKPRAKAPVTKHARRKAQ